MKKTVFIVSALMSFNAFAANEGWKNCDDEGTSNCEYQIKDGILTVRPQDDTQPANIPNYTRDCSMTRYSECTTTAPWRWDENANSVQTVNIESGITSVGSDAFEDIQMTSVNLPNSLTSIGSMAFIECRSLLNVNLPENLQNIGDFSFASTGLKSVIIPSGTESNPLVVDAYAFGAQWGSNGQVGESQIESLVVGNNVLINENAFIYAWNAKKSPFYLDNFKMYCTENNTSCTTALQKTLNYFKEIGNADASAQASDFLTTYTKDGNGFYQIGDKFYATADLMTHNAACDDAANCQAILNAASQGKPFEVGGKYYATLDLFANGAACTDKKNCEDILSSNGNPFKVGSKVYNSMADFANGNYVKHRIYTIEEANFVAGDKNRVSIRYR